MSTTVIPYPLRFQEIAPEQIASVFTELLSHPDFKATLERRNRELLSLQRLRAGSAEANNLVKRVCKTDEKLAVEMFAALAHQCCGVKDTVETVPLSDILAHYVDYSKSGNRDRVDRLIANLDKVTFLSDMLESFLVDIKSDVNKLFEGEVTFRQFDAVISVLIQLRGFFNNTRCNSDSTSQARDLYMEYADSINAYLDKRLKTYTERYRRIAPDRSKPVIRTKEEVMAALNHFFHTEFLADMTCKSMNGGYDADYMKLAMNLTKRQTEYLDAHVALPEQEPDNIRKYNRTLTEILFNKRKWKKW